MDNLQDLISKINSFTAARDWDQFHSPKNLSMALSVEVSELIEEFQWLTEKQSSELSQEKLNKVKDELGDIFIYLIRLSSKLGVDLFSAANEKILKNEIKYPVEKARGNAKKYKDFE